MSLGIDSRQLLPAFHNKNIVFNSTIYIKSVSVVILGITKKCVFLCFSSVFPQSSNKLMESGKAAHGMKVP